MLQKISFPLWCCSQTMLEGGQQPLTFFVIEGYVFSWQQCSLSLQTCTPAGGCLNIKMLSHQYRDSHLLNKMVSKPSYLYNGNPHTWKNCIYIKTGPCLFVFLLQPSHTATPQPGPDQSTMEDGASTTTAPQIINLEQDPYDEDQASKSMV